MVGSVDCVGSVLVEGSVEEPVSVVLGSVCVVPVDDELELVEEEFVAGLAVVLIEDLALVVVVLVAMVVVGGVVVVAAGVMGSPLLIRPRQPLTAQACRVPSGWSTSLPVALL